MRFLPLAVAMLAVAGCGSEAPQEVPSTPPAPRSESSAATKASQSSGDPVIVAFGDSLTAGYGLLPGESYPDLLGQELHKRGLDFDIVNEGISGDTTSTALSRLELVVARKPAYVIVAFGANDGLRGLSLERMEANLRRMIERLKTAHIEVILAGMKLPPNFGREYVLEFEQVYPRLAADLDTPLIPFLLEGVATSPALNQPDGIHPNAEGTRLVAANVANFLEPILRRAGR